MLQYSRQGTGQAFVTNSANAPLWAFTQSPGPPPGPLDLPERLVDTTRPEPRPTKPELVRVGQPRKVKLA